MSTEPKKKRNPSRKLQSAESKSRKERYSRDEGEPEFTVGEKASYFLRKGGPWVVAAVLLLAGVSWAVVNFRASVRPDQLSEAEEAEARQMISRAAKFERQGDEFVAAAELETLIKRFPNSIYREYAEELLQRHRSGEKMFTKEDGDDGLARIGERISRNKGDLAANSVSPGERRVRRNRQGAEDETAAANSEETPAEPSTKIEYPPDPPVPQTMEEALAKAPALKLDAKAKIHSLPEGFMIQGDAIHESGWPAVILCLADQSEMVFVPGGTVRIGQDQGPENERPSHTIQLAPYYIDRTEVTVGAYQEFLKANPDQPKLSDELAAKDPKHPAVGVTFAAAQAYCKWANKELPTEVQWEAAARGTQSALFPWGNHRETAALPSNDKSIDKVLTRPADRSDFGVFDMAGNAAEWCADWYSATAYQSAGSGNRVAITKPERVVRGGSPEWAVTWRASLSEDAPESWVGFRGVLNLPDAKPEPAPDVAAKEEPKRSRNTARSQSSAPAAAAPAQTPAAAPAAGRPQRSRRGRDDAPAQSSPVTSPRQPRSSRDGEATKEPPVVSPKKAPPKRGSDRDVGARDT